jgi:DNA-binding response OmpR family regulator
MLTEDNSAVVPTPVYQRVIIVEDDVTLRRIIARNLTRRGVAVIETGSAEEAITATRLDRPDLLLLDVNLPRRSGWDVLRELRSRSIDVPTIVISAVNPNAERLAEFRPLAYLPKPFPIEALLRIVISGRECQQEEAM